LEDETIFLSLSENARGNRRKIVGGKVDEKLKKEIEEGGRQSRKKKRQEIAKQNVGVRKTRKVKSDTANFLEDEKNQPHSSSSSDSEEGEKDKEYVRIFGSNLHAQWRGLVQCRQCNDGHFRRLSERQRKVQYFDLKNGDF